MQIIEKIKSKQNVFNILYFCFFLSLPLVYSNDIIDPVLIPRQIYLTFFLFIVCSIACYQIFTKKLSPDFSFSKMALPVLLMVFLLCILVSFSKSVAITESIYVLSKIMIEVLFFIVTAFLIIHKKLEVTCLIKSIIVFCIVSVVITIYQILVLCSSEYTLLNSVIMIKSTFANKNLLSSILFLTIPFLFCSIYLSKLWKILSMILFFIIMILLWLIQTKAVIIAFFVFFIIFLSFFMRYRKGFSESSFLKIILAISIFIIIVAGIVSWQNSKGFTHLTNRHTAITRFSLWENSVYMIKDHWAFGVGAGNWQIYFPKYTLDKFLPEVKMGTTTYQRPHNDFLWVFCELGVVGILTFISIFLIILFYLYRLIRISKKWEAKWPYVSLLAGIIGFNLISFVDFPLERIEHQILLYLMFSIIVALYYENIIRQKLSNRLLVNLKLLLLIMSITLLFSFYVSINRYIGEFHTHKLIVAHHRANWTTMIREADKAVNPCYSIDPASAPIEWYKGVALFTMGDVDAAKRSFEKAYVIHPNNIHVLNNLASCYEKQGDHKKSEELYLESLAISSGFEEALLNLSAVYYNNKDYEKAFTTIDKCSINCIDPKYKIFLSAILKAELNVLISKQYAPDIIKKLGDVKNSEEKILNYYFDSKRKNVNFTTYLINN